jgi:hypothetical protein
MNAMSLRILSLTLLLSVPATALAGGRVVLEIDCADRVRPGLQQFAADAGIASAHLASRMRHQAWAEAVRACHRGYDRVRITRVRVGAETVLHVAKH